VDVDLWRSHATASYLFCSGIWSYISCCDVFSSYPHVTSGSCHFMLLVTVSHTRMRCCMSDSLRTEIRACIYGISHRIYPITYLTTGIWSADGASHESFSHACQITCVWCSLWLHVHVFIVSVTVHMFSHCSVIVLCVTLQGMYCPFINFMLWSPRRFFQAHGYYHPRIRDR
jgi:hypothetical protein